MCAISDQHDRQSARPKRQIEQLGINENMISTSRNCVLNAQVFSSDCLYSDPEEFSKAWRIKEHHGRFILIIAPKTSIGMPRATHPAMPHRAMMIVANRIVAIMKSSTVAEVRLKPISDQVFRPSYIRASARRFPLAIEAFKNESRTLPEP